MKITDALTVLFVALKLTGHIDWSWGLIVLPSIISLLALVAVSMAKEDR